MDTTLVINPGSSSKKYAIYKGEKEVYTACFERTGDSYGVCVTINKAQQRCEDIGRTTYSGSLSACLTMARKEGVIRLNDDIDVVAFRVVAPHPHFTTHRILTERSEQLLQSLALVAPLHIPSTLEEIHAAHIFLPHAVRVSISDSAFHATMPNCASLYSVPHGDCEELNLIRYGYHGISVSSVVHELRERVHGLPERVLVAHIGSGVSVSALRKGECVDTTMGFGPASGLIMGTRGGDLDGPALLHIERSKGFTPARTEEYLNRETGLLGLTGTSDLRHIINRAKGGDPRSARAFEAFIYHIQKALHSFVGVLGGLDAVVLTATAAERNPYLRERVLESLAYRGFVLDHNENERVSECFGKISAPDSQIEVYVVPTEEMREMARLAGEVYRGRETLN